jgi:hypothetical protein
MIAINKKPIGTVLSYFDGDPDESEVDEFFNQLRSRGSYVWLVKIRLNKGFKTMS